MLNILPVPQFKCLKWKCLSFAFRLSFGSIVASAGIFLVLTILVQPSSAETNFARTTLNQSNLAKTEEELFSQFDQLDASVPTTATAFLELTPKTISDLSQTFADNITAYSQDTTPSSPEMILAKVSSMGMLKARMDALLNRELKLRFAFLEMSDSSQQTKALQHYLQVMDRMVDLSGRVNSAFIETANNAAIAFASRPELRDKLIDLLAKQQKSLGAQVMSLALIDPPQQTRNNAQPASTKTKSNLLNMIAESGNVECIPTVARFLRVQAAPADLKVQAIATLEQLGIPQDARPVPSGRPASPSITSSELYKMLSEVKESELSASWQQQRTNLLTKLKHQSENGLINNSFRWGKANIQSGDWILTRNPSPYNIFTTLSPGMFTHVGVVTNELGTDNKQRMVVVEMRERGKRVPASNVEEFLSRTLHYVILRHQDPKVCETMGNAARDVINNPMEFDLNFDTTRVIALKGQPLAGKTIHTYCAGLLLLCAQDTGVPREQFFPLAETAQGKWTDSNLLKLGARLGKDFISPTGPLFAQGMKVVDRRDTIYDPGREIEQGVFDHFGHMIMHTELHPTRDLYQSLRVRMATMSKSNPLLAKALAASAGVDEDTDLVSAAKAAAAIESLDEIAYGCSREFREALVAMETTTLEQFKREGFSEAELKLMQDLRKKFSALYAQILAGKANAMQTEKLLVDYYIKWGQYRINLRFFKPPSTDQQSSSK